MNKVLVSILIIVVLVIVGLVLISQPAQNDTAMPRRKTVLAPAPQFSLEDYNGTTVSLADFRGKPVVVNSWAVWCPFCAEELKDFAAVKSEFGDQLEIIAIDRAEPLERAKKFTDELGLTNRLIFLLDPTDSFYRSIGGFSMPETIFVDKEGQVRFHKRGPMDLEEIRERIQTIL